MIRYEWKKVFCRRSNQIALVLLLAVLALCCHFALGVSYVDPQGETTSGVSAGRALRQLQKEWSGPLDEAKLRRVLEENQRINQETVARFGSDQDNDIAYAQKQGFSEIRDLFNWAFSDNFRTYDYYRVDSLVPDDAARFYPQRIALLQSWLAEPEQELQFSQREKDFLVGQYEALETPLEYDCVLGWNQLFEFAPTIEMVAILVLGYLVAGIFSNEFTWRSDAILFSSFHGRGKVVRAKLCTGLGLISVVYWGIMLLYSAIVLLGLGTDGWNCAVQLLNWKIFYNVQIWQQYILVLLGGYIGCLFMGVLTMLCSAKSRSTVLSVLIPFALIFLPTFLTNLAGANTYLSRILGLLPDHLLQVSVCMSFFDLYTIGDRVVGAIPILLPLYALLSVLLLPVLYQTYRRKQIL